MVKKNFLKSSLIILVAVAMLVAVLPIASVKATGAKPILTYSAHAQTYGWDKTGGVVTAASAIEDAKLVGTTGESKRVEALKLNFKAVDAKLEANVHVQGKGWMGWTTIGDEDVIVGTQGESKRVESIKFSVTGLTDYAIWYRAHVQGKGWMDWVKATDSKDLSKNFAGTAGECKRIEALEIVILSSADNDFFESKQKAIKELKDYLDSSLYTANIEKVNSIVDQYVGYLESVTKNQGLKKLQQLLGVGKKQLDAIPSDASLATTLESRIDYYVDIIEDSFEKTLKETNVRGNKAEGSYLDDRAIKASVESAKALIRSAKNIEEVEELYNTAGDGILSSVEEYVKEYLENVYNNGLVKDNVTYLLAEGDYNSLVNHIDATLANKTPNRGTRMAALIAVLNASNPGTLNMTLDYCLRTVATVRDYYKNSVLLGKYANNILTETTNFGKIERTLKGTKTKWEDVDGVKYYYDLAMTKFDEESNDTYAEFDKIVNDAEKGIYSSVKAFIENALVSMETVGNPAYKEPSKLVTLHTLLSNPETTSVELMTEFNNIFAEA